MGHGDAKKRRHKSVASEDIINIENISLLGHVFEQAGHEIFPSKQPKLFDRLTKINLDIDLGNLKEAQAAHYLFRNAPNLQRIELQLIYKGYAAPTSHFWDSIDRQVGLFRNLGVVVLINFAGSPAELGFLKLLLEEAPVLRKAQINDKGKLDTEALKHLLKMRRASKDAEIVFI
ncbi:hypothetical protein QOZ80_5BG0420390 [Eleusine coracana subsp. coracana]|nr:hypothetical protein QOZ80_5BG0420390 [Eleusine coracana subsp. coracana]